MVSYSNDVKHRLLGVSRETLESYGAVSEQVAAQMAEGVRKACDTSLGISTTGIAGPTGGSEAKPVGTVCFGISLLKPDGRQVDITMTFRFPGTRERVIEAASRRALILAIKHLLSNFE